MKKLGKDKSKNYSREKSLYSFEQVKETFCMKLNLRVSKHPKHKHLDTFGDLNAISHDSWTPCLEHFALVN